MNHVAPAGYNAAILSAAAKLSDKPGVEPDYMTNRIRCKEIRRRLPQQLEIKGGLLFDFVWEND
jgi:hypothetical protein